jgi:DNA-binding response OmpR family regulator
MAVTKSAGMVFEDAPVSGTSVVTASDPIRLAIIDSDSGFVRVLIRRADALGWQYRRLEAPPRIEEFVAMRVHAVVVDLAVLREGAWEFLERLAGGLPGLGIVVCTGPSTVAQRVRGLRLGAADWVTKPAHPEEVLARVEAVTRRGKRAGAPADEQPVMAGELEIRSDRFQAYAAGRSVDLTRREFELLQLLADAEGKVLEREQIYQAVWGYAMAHGDRSVDVFIRKLRQKLEKASPDWEYIHTHFGVGYRFDAERLGEPESEPQDVLPTELRPATVPPHRPAVSSERQAAPGTASASGRAI